MAKIKRILSFLLVVCLVASLPLAAFHVMAAEITTSQTIDALASGSASALTSIENAITAGTVDTNGVYYAFTFPAQLSFSAGLLGTEEYTLMAASALCELADGSASTTAINYHDMTFATDEIACGSGTTLTRGQYLDLAERAHRYGSTLYTLPTSFNRPSDGTNTYDGRISVYSLVHIFAEALAAYSADGALPESVTFLPTHASGITFEDTSSDESTETTTDATTEATTTADTTETTTADTTAVATQNTIDVIALEGKQIEEWVKANSAIPNYSTLSTGDQFTPAQMLYIFCKAIVDLGNGVTTNIYTSDTMDEAPSSNGDQSSGSIQKSEYLDMASRTAVFMETYGAAPNYCTSSTLGTIQYEELLYFFAKILSYYYTNGTLPDSMTTYGWGLDENSSSDSSSGGDATFGVDYSSYSSYLKSSTYCQSTNSTIISVAKTGMYYSSGTYGGYSSPSSTYQAMFNLFEYLNDKMSYDYYYDTQKGALKSWNSKYANCCDHAHLMNACSRSLGVPGRYVHGYCKFTSMSTGHVWSEVLCGSKWYTADLVSNYNYLGYKTNTTVTLYNRYATLPF